MGNAFNKKKKQKCLMLGLNDSGKSTILYKLITGECVKFASTTNFNHEAMQYNTTTFDVYDIGWIFYKYNLKEPTNLKVLDPDSIGCYLDKDGNNIKCNFDAQDTNTFASDIDVYANTLNFRKSIQQIYDEYDTRKLFENTDAIIFVIDSDDPYSFTNDEKYKTKMKSNYDTDPYLNDGIFVKQYTSNIMRAYKMNIPNGILDIIAKYYTRKFETSVKYLIETFLDMEEFNDCPILLWTNKQDKPQAFSVGTICDSLNIFELLKGRNWYIQNCCAWTGDGLYEGLDWLCFG